MDNIIHEYKAKFERIFSGEDPNLVFNRRDIDENGRTL